MRDASCSSGHTWPSHKGSRPSPPCSRPATPRGAGWARYSLSSRYASVFILGRSSLRRRRLRSAATWAFYPFGSSMARSASEITVLTQENGGTARRDRPLAPKTPTCRPQSHAPGPQNHFTARKVSRSPEPRTARESRRQPELCGLTQDRSFVGLGHLPFGCGGNLAGFLSVSATPGATRNREVLSDQTAGVRARSSPDQCYLGFAGAVTLFGAGVGSWAGADADASWAATVSGLVAS